VGPYHVEALLGSGGMGEVYRVKDPRLGRDVALKLLPPEAADPERRQRFAREAQVVAALNHPNIVTIHSVEQSGDLHFLTMELVDGTTLREMIPSRGLPLDQLLRLAIPLADAVGAAHSKGVVHRDLKPGNVMVTRDGRVKVLDFGLAKLKPSESFSAESTVTHGEITTEGRVLGTIAYMSPEQAEGRDVDHRSDIFSFGVLLYEIATGERPFTGDTTVSLLSSILKDPPPILTQKRPDLPRELERVVRRCLAKDPGHRYQSVVDLRIDLEEIQQELSSGQLSSNRTVHSVRRSGANRVAWFAAGLVLLAGAVGLGYFAALKQAPPASARKLRLTLNPPSGVQVAPQVAAPIIAVSPDGEWVAFQGTSSDPNRSGLYLRSVSELDARQMRTGDASSPFFSADSRWLGYWADGSIWKVPVAGGQPERICEAPNQLRGASWGDDGTVVFTDGKDGLLRRVPQSGVPAPVLTQPETAHRVFFPHVLPGSKAILGMLLPERTIALISLETGQILRRWFSGSTPEYAQGFLIFRRSNDLFAVAFDRERQNVTGDPQAVGGPVRYNPGGSETSAFAMAMTGALVYVPSSERGGNAELAWLDDEGRSEPVGAGASDYRSPSLDPDGRRVAVHVNSGGAPGDYDVWTYDIGTKNWSRLTRGLRTSTQIVWSADGQWLVFSSNKPGYPALFRIRADGGEPMQLTDRAEYGAYANAYDHATSLRGNVLMFERQVGPDDFDLFTMRLEPRGAPQPYLRSEALTFQGQMSPDSRWVAYASNEAGGRQIFVRSYSEPSRGRVFVASNADKPRWSRDGRRLFFVRNDEIWAIPVTPDAKGKDVSVGKDKRLSGNRDVSAEIEIGMSPEPSADEMRFLVVKRPRTERRLVYVPNWLDEVRSKATRVR